MSGTKILWGQIVVVFAVVLASVWGATQWAAWRLGYQPELGSPWAELGGVPLYPPPALFWWWYWYDAYAPGLFLEAGLIAAAGGFAAIGIAIGMSIWRANADRFNRLVADHHHRGRRGIRDRPARPAGLARHGSGPVRLLPAWADHVGDSAAH